MGEYKINHEIVSVDEKLNDFLQSEEFTSKVLNGELNMFELINIKNKYIETITTVTEEGEN